MNRATQLRVAAVKTHIQLGKDTGAYKGIWA